MPTFFNLLDPENQYNTVYFLLEMSSIKKAKFMSNLKFLHNMAINSNSHDWNNVTHYQSFKGTLYNTSLLNCDLIRKISVSFCHMAIAPELLVIMPYVKISEQITVKNLDNLWCIFSLSMFFVKIEIKILWVFSECTLFH